MKTVGVILAGGIGVRLGLSQPKQMVKVAGKTILEHTLTVFEESKAIDEIVLMITPGWAENTATMLGDRFEKLTKILEGGSTRNDTTRRFLESLGGEECKIILHDAVRPLLDQRIIDECVAALDTFDAVDVVIPSADTIVEVDESGAVTNIPDRSLLRRGQTPQAFTANVLQEAYEQAAKDPNFSATDDCGVVLKYSPEVPITTVLGSEHNIKVTEPVDLFIADKLFQLASQTAPERLSPEARREALGGKTVIVLGGSYGIGAEIGRLMGDAGANVIAHGRSSTGLHVEDPRAIAAAFEEAFNQYGAIDAVVLTAGLLKVGPLANTPAEDLEQLIGVNFLAPIHVARAAYPFLKLSQGHLLLFTSSSYTRGRENYAIYSSSKAGVVNLTQALSEEWATDGIKVNVINPERTATPMRTAAFGEEAASTLLSAESVAETALDVMTSDTTGMVIDVRKGQEGALSAAEAIERALREQGDEGANE